MTYPSSVSIGRQRFATRHQNAVSMAEQARNIGPVSNSIVLVILSCLLGLLYLTQVTKTNASGYKIDQMKKEYSQLERDHNQLELSAARLQSMDRVSSSPATQGLVSIAPSGIVQ